MAGGGQAGGGAGGAQAGGGPGGGGRGREDLARQLAGPRSLCGPRGLEAQRPLCEAELQGPASKVILERE